ncbi:MAG: sugar ABC transporter ATP-binding protein [bacterium]
MAIPLNILEVHALRKEYPGTIALKGVSLKFSGGKIHALLGKNGAGKSTLVKIIAGVTEPTSGAIILNGQTLELKSPRDALNKGIASVHQELSLVPELSVAENILLGRLPKRRGLGQLVIDWDAAYAMAEDVLKRLEVKLDVRTEARRLSVAQQQIVEIAKAMIYDPSILILDEPTSALANHETERLFVLLRQLAEQGVILLYITHRLQELPQIADSVSVLRNGDYIGTVEKQQATPATIAHMMFGEVVQHVRPADLPEPKEPLLTVKNFSRKGAFHNVSFTLKRGEILGIAGLLGSGRTELLRAIFGADPAESGELLLDNNTIHPRSPVQMKGHGFALTPENRKEEGLVQMLSTKLNLTLSCFDRIAPKGFLLREKERELVKHNIAALDITLSDEGDPVSLLSGGNQQKVVVGKWLNTNPRVVLFDEPTRGIDVQAKQQMFQIIWELSRKGISSIVVSSELEELISVCHRILIMRNGEIGGEVNPADVAIHDLFVHCMHGSEQAVLSS